MAFFNSILHMKLLYVWIEKFRNIENRGFNFSSEYKVEYSKVTNSVTINEQKEFIPDFFSENISDITAIIGKNGTGKSNVLDFICTAIASGRKQDRESKRGKLNNDYLLVFESKKEFKFLGKTQKRNLNNSIIKFNGIDHPLNYKPEANWESVFFSNVADNRNLTFEGNDTFTLSYKNNSKNKANKIKYLEYVHKKIENSNDGYITPLEHQINFDKLTFSLTIVSDLYFPIDKEDEKYKKLMERYTVAYTANDSVSRFSYFLTKGLLCALYSKVKQKLVSPSLFDSLLDDLELVQTKDGVVAEKIITLRQKVLNTLKDYSKEESIQEFMNVSDYNLYIELIEKLLNPENDVPKDDITVSGNKLTIEFSRKLMNLLMEYSSVFNYNDIIEHDWDKMSSGFKAYLNMFANIYSVIGEIKHENILICIDEGDIYFHPEMQRHFLKDLLEYIKSIFSQKNIQIILTSHSPFLAADLPKDNLILMRYEEKTLVVENSAKKTFASNVYQLYNDQFFLDKGSMGEFAKGKIQEIIDKINGIKLKTNQQYMDELLHLINKFGDEMIQKRLLELIHKKQSQLNRESKLLLINWYQEQINSLK